MAAKETPRQMLGATFINILTVLAVIAILIAGVITFGSVTGDWQISPVLTGSMEPTIPTHSAVVLRPKSVTKLTVGDVLAFKSCAPNAGPETIIHRVVKIDSGEGTSQPVIETKGDNNNVEDVGQCRVQTNPVYTVHTVIPHVGSVVLWFQKPIVKIGLILLALLVLIWPMLSSLWSSGEENVAKVLDEADSNLTAPSRLAELAKHENWRVRAAVAGNTAANAETLVALDDDNDKRVSQAARANINFPTTAAEGTTEAAAPAETPVSTEAPAQTEDSLFSQLTSESQQAATPVEESTSAEEPNSTEE